MKAIATKLTTLGFPEAAAQAFIRAALVLGFTLATAAAAQIEIPVPGTIVPMTLQTAIVLLAGLSLGKRDGALSQLIYIVGGAVGLPFFALSGGPATFGYLGGFVLAAWFAGSIPTKGKFARAWLVAFGASLLIFIPGVIQLKTFTLVSWEQAIAMGVMPFIMADLVKVTFAATAHRLHHQFK